MLRTALLLLASTFAAYAADAPTTASAPEDPRQLVTMPDAARALMRQDMLEHLNSLTQILGLLAAGDLNAAADVAENRMGKSAMGKHRGSGMAPGMYMTREMRELGWGLHEAASHFAQIARQGESAAAYGALQEVTANCITCHATYRTR